MSSGAVERSIPHEHTSASQNEISSCGKKADSKRLIALTKGTGGEFISQKWKSKNGVHLSRVAQIPMPVLSIGHFSLGSFLSSRSQGLLKVTSRDCFVVCSWTKWSPSMKLCFKSWYNPNKITLFTYQSWGNRSWWIPVEGSFKVSLPPVLTTEMNKWSDLFLQCYIDNSMFLQGNRRCSQAADWRHMSFDYNLQFYHQMLQKTTTTPFFLTIKNMSLIVPSEYLNTFTNTNLNRDYLCFRIPPRGNSVCYKQAFPAKDEK